MGPVFDYFPAHAVRPCVRPHGSGAVFSAAFRDGGEHGLQLIHRRSAETVYIPLTDEYRVGQVYSVRVDPFDADEWFYRYRSGARWILDPNAYGVCRAVVRDEGSGEDGAGEEASVCSCAPLRAQEFLDGTLEPQLPKLSPADWNRQVVYGLHVRGFTAAQPENACVQPHGAAGQPEDAAAQPENPAPQPGTFACLQSRIPYLQELGVTAVELMPVYTPLPARKKTGKYRTMQEALSAWPVGPNGDPLRDMKERPNYWGFGRGMYYALRAEYGTREEFARMVRSFHRAGIRVILQLCFEKGSRVQDQIEVIRHYVLRFGVDGFRLMGYLPSAADIALEPSLSGTTFFFDGFPYGENDLSDEEGDEEGQAGLSLPGVVTCGEDFRTLLRRFVKSDDHVMKDFLKLFLRVPTEHGELRYVTGFDGFTLADLVSYNERHNEANGEFGLDGRTDDYSWNCGEEGDTSDPGILALRRKQIRNFLTLLFLSQGTVRLWQGDERLHSQGGNNNPYCQDNATSWVDWSPSPEKKALTAFTARLSEFRRSHPVFGSGAPFHYIDTLGIGHPDVSIHGEEAWKPDLEPFSHSIGICFCENYRQSGPGKLGDAADGVTFFRSRGRVMLPAFTYLAVNTYWEKLSLALPKLPPHYVWKVFLDTSVEEGFLERPVAPPDPLSVETEPRSIRLLRAVPDAEAIRKERLKERVEALPPMGAVRRCLRTGRRAAATSHYCKRGSGRALRGAATML